MSNLSEEKSQSIESEDIDALRKELGSVAWIQCDNSQCLKWRKVHKRVAASLTKDSVWTCDMNEDPAHQSCLSLEEDTNEFDRLTKRAKLDLIRSELVPGQLVWAKIPGYCRWPALVTPDPLNGLHSWTDENETKIVSYHVEFLGSQRCHGWVNLKSVQVFCHSSLDGVMEKQLSEGTQKGRTKSGVKKKFRSRCKILPVTTKKEKTRYGKSTVDDSIKEALKLLKKSVSERLLTVKFRAENNANDESEPQEKKKVPQRSPSIHHTKVKSSQECPKPKLGRPPKKTSLNGESSNKSDSRTKREERRKARKRARYQVEEIHQPKFRSFDFNTSLIDVSKEERFLLDIEEYKRNEKGFLHDLTRFQLRNGMQVAPKPVWNNISINLFSLFLAVYERGGFDMVCEQKEWCQVYSELVECTFKYGGARAKRFYEKHMYLYELYATGQDWVEPYLESQSSTDLNKETKSDKKIFKSASTSSNNDRDESTSLSDDSFNAPEVLEQLKDLEDILQTLCGADGTSSAEQCVPDLQQGQFTWQLPQPKSKSLSTSSQGEYYVENAQIVPKLDYSSSNEEDDKADQIVNVDEDSTSSEYDPVFHELQNLDQGIAALQDEVDQL